MLVEGECLHHLAIDLLILSRDIILVTTRIAGPATHEELAAGGEGGVSAE
jgi:hypothetical protein